MDKLLGRKQRPESKPPDCLARYNCVKHSWRGRLRRVFCITPTAVHTQNPDKTLVLTNSYTFVDDSDLETVSIGSDEFEFTISVRQDKRSKFKPVKFTCKHRELLLTDLFQCLSAAAALGRCKAAAKVLGTPQPLGAARWCPAQGAWVGVALRVTATGLEEVAAAGDATAGGTVVWRCDYVHLASPGMALLLPSPATLASAHPPPHPPPAPGSRASAAAGTGGDVVDGVFAVLPGPGGGGGRGHPRLYSCRQREVLVKALVAEGRSKLGVTVNVDTRAAVTAQQLLSQWSAAQESGAASSASAPSSYTTSGTGPLQEGSGGAGAAAAQARGDTPLGQWEVEALLPRAEVVPGQLAAAAPQVSGRRWTLEQLAAAPLLNVPAGGNLVPTRLVVTSTHLLERSVTSHALERRTPLASIAALVRFASDPKLLGVEWEGGGPPSAYVTVARDAVLALLLDAAQAVAGRPIAVLPGFTFPGDVVVTDHKHPSHAPATELDADLLGLYLRELGIRGRDLAPAIAAAGATSGSGGGGASGLTAVTSSSSLLSSSPSFLDGPPTPPGRPPSSSGSSGGNPFPAASRGAPGAPPHSSLESVTPAEAAALLMEVVYEFNACVPYSGVPPGAEVDGVEGPALLALAGLLPVHVSTSASLTSDDVKQVVAVLQCMQRLASHPGLAEQLLGVPGLLTRLWTLAAAGIGAGAAKAAAAATAKAASSGSSAVAAGGDGQLGGGDDHVTAEVGRLLLRLWAPSAARRGAAPWRVARGSAVAASVAAAAAAAAAATAADELAAAAVEDGATARSAKLLCFPPNLMSHRLGLLLGPLGVHPPVSPLTSMCLLEAVAALAVDPGARTSDPALVTATLETAAGLGRPLFALFTHPAPRVGDGLAVLMRGVAGCGPGAAAPMRDAALREGALLHHLNQALFGTGARAALSQQLVAAWSDGYAPALTLLRRILPPGLVRYLNVPQTQPVAPPSPPPEPSTPSDTTPTAASGAASAQQQAAAAAQAAAQAAQAAMSSAAAAVSSTFKKGVASVSSAIAAASGSVMQEGGSSDAAVTPLTASLMQQSQQQQQERAAGLAPGAGAPPAAPPQGGNNGSAPAAATSGTTTDAATSGSVSAGTPTAVGSAVGGSGGLVGPLQATPASAPGDGGSAQGAPTAAAAAAAAAPSAGVAAPTAGAGEPLPLPAVAVAPRPVAPPRPPLSAGLKGNWGALWEAAARDHCHAGLVWNAATRGELREALGREEGALGAARLRVAQGAGSWPSWNWSEFRVDYPSLAAQLCIGGVYIRLLLEGADPAAIDKVSAPKDLFTACYHTLLCCLTDDAAGLSGTAGGTVKAQQAEAAVQAKQLLCVQAMAAAYSAHAGIIGPFEGMEHLLRLMDRTPLRSLRHALLLLLQSLVMPRAAGPPAAAAALAAAFATAVTGRGGNITTLPKLAAAGGPAVNGQQLGSGQTLTGPQAAALRAAKANGYALLDAGGLELLVAVVAGAHECSERRAAAVAAGGVATVGAGHLLTSISHDQVPKEWYYYPHGYQPEGAQPAAPTPPSSNDTPTPDAPHPVDEAGRAGPITKDELKQLLSKGTITPTTHLWAAGMPQPRQYSDIRELRWMAARGGGLLGPFDAALVALQLLQQLAALQPAVDEQGCVLTPLPRVHRELAAPGCLPHLVQVLLTGEPALVAASCQLLVLVLSHNRPALSRLYISGAFFFALAYCGSNLEEVAMLLKVAHLVQAHRGPAELSAGLPLAQRSYLGELLPESLLHMLDSYGPGVFAAALGGDHDTPELVWTNSMRAGRLVPALLQHLGDFPHRLAQHCGAVYDFTPCPPLTWPDLGGEVWCHRYYLRNLTDEVRFRDWPVVEHLPLLQALMEQWRAELARQPLAMSEGAACEALGLVAGPDGTVGEEDMRRAYRQAARRYHPDKNPDPSARAKFLTIQKAYQRLVAGAAGGQGPQPWRVLLMLRAQVILYRRYSTVLAPFKYAGYPQLLEVLRQQTPTSATSSSSSSSVPPAAAPNSNGPSSAAPPSGATAAATDGAAAAAGGTSTSDAHTGGSSGGSSGHFLSPERVDLVLAAIELCWLTCAASQRNAEELLRAGGVGVLGDLLSRCVAVMPLGVGPTEQVAVVTTHLLRSFAGMAAVEAGRTALAGRPTLVGDLVRCCSLERAPAAADAALLAIAHAAASPACQQLLLEVGVLPHVVPLLLAYDPTLSAEAAARLAVPFTPGASSIASGSSGKAGEGGSGGGEGLALLDTPLVRGSQAEARSQHALLAARALGRLAGVLAPPFTTPANDTARAALSALLTPALAGQLGAGQLGGLLGPLGSSLETAQVIWNSGMREELLKVLAAQRASGPNLPALLSFAFTSLAGELQVGGVFVRVFNARTAPGGRAAASAATVTTSLAAAAGAGGGGPGGGPAAAAVLNPLGGTTAAATGAGSTLHAAAAAAALPAGVSSSSSSGAPADPPGFCKALVRFLYERLVERCFRGSKLGGLSPKERADCLEVLTALTRLLTSEPRLLGLLASKSAVGAVVAALAPAAATWPPLMQAADKAAAGGAGTTTGTNILAAAAAAADAGAGDEATTATSEAQQDAPLQQQQQPASSSSGPPDSPQQLAADAERLAASSLSLLLLLSQSAPVLDVLVDEPFLRQLHWLLYTPPSFRVLELTLSLLKSVAPTATAAVVAGYQGGAVLLLNVLLHQGAWPWPGGAAPSPEAEAGVVAAAAGVLGRVMSQAGHGPRVVLLLGQLLPPGLVAALQEGPEEGVVTALRTAVESPECMWDAQMASQAAAEVAALSATIRQQQAAGKAEWALAPGAALRYAKLAGEVYVGGVYVRLFMKNPGYSIRDPQRFSEALLHKFLAELQAPPGSQSSGADATSTLLLLSAAAVALLQGHALLADHVAQLGYASRLLVCLAARTAAIPALPPPPGSGDTAAGAAAAAPPPVVVAPDEVGGSILRLLHQLAASPAASEALASASSAPLVPTAMKAMRWGHGATLLVLELLKRSLAPGNRQRDTLVGQALSCGLPQALLTMLDWRQGEAGGAGAAAAAAEQEAQVQRALAVDVLTALAEEGAYGAQVGALLAGSEVWGAYRGQRHDMFLPSGATADSGVVGLLTAGDTARYALPPTEDPGGGAGGGGGS